MNINVGNHISYSFGCNICCSSSQEENCLTFLYMLLANTTLTKGTKGVTVTHGAHVEITELTLIMDFTGQKPSLRDLCCAYRFFSMAYLTL